MKTKTLLLTAGLVLTGAAALAQYAVDWFKVAGGGGTSTGGNYALSGTIGQADAGGPLTGGNYTLTGGYWSAAASLIQEPGGPQLSIAVNPDSTITIRWPSPSTGYVLQQTENVATGWTNSALAVADNGSVRSVTFVPQGPRHYFRLRRPQ